MINIAELLSQNLIEEINVDSEEQRFGFLYMHTGYIIESDGDMYVAKGLRINRDTNRHEWIVENQSNESYFDFDDVNYFKYKRSN